MKITFARTAAFVVTATTGMAVGYALAKSTYPPVEVLVSSEKTTIGQDIVYPDAMPKITGAIVTMQPGATTGWHKHDAPLFGWILEGEVTVDYAEAGTKTYKKGDAFIEALKSYHNGTNTGDSITRILAVFAGADGVENTVMKED